VQRRDLGRKRTHILRGISVTHGKTVTQTRSRTWDHHERLTREHEGNTHKEAEAALLLLVLKVSVLGTLVIARTGRAVASAAAATASCAALCVACEISDTGKSVRNVPQARSLGNETRKRREGAGFTVSTPCRGSRRS
jgi:hypothetical protein